MEEPACIVISGPVQKEIVKGRWVQGGGGKREEARKETGSLAEEVGESGAREAG